MRIIWHLKCIVHSVIAIESCMAKLCANLAMNFVAYMILIRWLIWVKLSKIQLIWRIKKFGYFELPRLLLFLPPLWFQPLLPLLLLWPCQCCKLRLLKFATISKEKIAVDSSYLDSFSNKRFFRLWFLFKKWFFSI